MSQTFAPTRLRALFLSDFHLGSRASRPGMVLEFLAAHEADTIYLVGDILDLWHGCKVHWGADASAIVAELEARASRGVRVVYLAGNHDAPLRAPRAALPRGWELREALTHEAADGQRYLVLHGDQCDSRLMRWHFMTRIGSRADAMIRALDDWFARRFGPPRSHRPSRIQRLIVAFNELFIMGGRFETRLVALAKATGADGVICGHSHKPALKELDGATYANCGDWVDSLTALTEDHTGALRLVEWVPEEAPAPSPANRPQEA